MIRKGYSISKSKIMSRNWNGFSRFYCQVLTLCKSIFKIIIFGKDKLETTSNKANNRQMTLLKNIILENSFRDAGVIDTAFPYMMLGDSLASTFLTLDAVMLSQIMVVDEDNNLFGVLDKESILREFVPSKNFILQKVSSQDKYLIQKTSEAIRTISKETLYDFRHIIRKTKAFREEEFLFYGIRYFLSHGHLTDDLLAITDDNLSLVGTISGKNILKYLLKCTNLDDFSNNVGLAISAYPNIVSEAVACKANEPLENALYITNHTAAICILIKKNNQFVGFLTREMINQQIHPLYPDFLNYPMSKFMKNLAQSDILNSDTSLTKLCYNLIESTESFVFVKTSTKHKTASGRNTSLVEYKAISVKSLLDFLLRKMDSHL